MAGQTQYLGLYFFDFGDNLGTPTNVQKEADRFILIDKQLYGLYSIFGNGVITGWIVEDNGFSVVDGISVIVTPGIGIIRSIAAETTFPETVSNLTPNTMLGIYAVLEATTPQDRGIHFVASFVDLGDYAIKIANVVVGPNAVASIDNNVRDLIGFENTIREQIDAHKHRGTPTKIDLAEETKNQLPGARISGFDTSKITSGKFNVDRLPIIDHNNLDNNGILTHAQLDSFVQSLSENNKELFGEIASVNLLKHIIFMKYKYANVDEQFLNELALIPGISPNNFIDFESSTAHIDLGQHCISGLDGRSGEFITVRWDDNTSFNNAYSKTNVEIVGDIVTLTMDTEAIEIVENFENVSASGDSIPGFSKTTVVVKDNLSLTAESADSLHMEGFYSGKFSSSRDYRAMFTKTFLSPRDWSGFNELIVNVKTISESHGAVYAYYVYKTSSGQEQFSDLFLLLSANEVTDNPEATERDFEQRIFSIVDQNRTNIIKFIIFTDDTQDDFKFYIDDIYLRNTALFSPQGTIRFRYTSGSQLTFHSIYYTIDKPDGTAVSIRVKVANTEELLSRATYTRLLNSGDIFALPGQSAEVEVTLTTTNTLISPTLRSVELRLLAPADHYGFSVNSISQWSLGDMRNLELTSIGTNNYVRLEEPINVGGLYFSFTDAIREIDDESVGVFGFSGANMPIAPNQAIDWVNNFTKFEDAVSVVRRLDKTFLIADRSNDRVLEVDSLGILVRGFGSANAIDNDFYPSTAVYNPSLGILTITATKDIDKSSVDLTKVSIYIGDTEIKLGSSDTILNMSRSNKILEIQLSTDKIAQLSGRTTDISVSFAAGSFAERIILSDNALSLLGTKGLNAFIGNFVYVDGISHPVFVDILDNDNWVVANAGIIDSGTSIASDENAAALIEFDPDTPSILEFSYNDILFSDFSLGSISEFGTDRLVISGIFETDTALSSTTEITTSAPSGTVEQTVSIDTTNSSSESADAASVLLSATDNSYGIKRNDTNASVVANFTTPSHPSVGRYEYTFRGEVGVEYTVSWRVVQTAGSDPVFTEQVLTIAATDVSNLYQRAVNTLATYRGIVAIVDKTFGNRVFEYISPDGLYASDVDIDSDGNLLVAESSFANATGRIVKLDSFGNIIWAVGSNGDFTKINDAKAVSNGNVILSM